MKLVKWMLIAFVTCLLSVVGAVLVRRAVTPSRPVAPLAQSAQPSRLRVPVETVAETRVGIGSAASASPKVSPASAPRAPVVATPIGKLPAPSALVAGAPPALPSPPSARPTATPTPSPTPQFVFEPSVLRAQKLLAELGYEVGKPDGKLGPRTAAALETFQKEHALALTKKADEATLARLEEEAKRRAIAKLAATPAAVAAVGGTPAPQATPKPRALGEPQVIVVKGSNSDSEARQVPALDNRADVVRLQKALAAAGLYEGAIDGRWGKGSAAALTAFQKKNGLTASGKPDAATWQKLLTAAGPTPTPVPDLFVVAPVSKTLKKSKFSDKLRWYSPEAAVVAGSPESSMRGAASEPASPKAAAAPSAPAGAGSASPTPVIRPASTTPSQGASGSVAGKTEGESSGVGPAAPATPSAPSTSLDVANASGAVPTSSHRTPAGEAPVLLPKSPSDRSTSTYAENVLARAQAPEARIETVARQQETAQLLVERAERTTGTASTAAVVQDPNSLSARLRAAARELEQAPSKSKREQAAEKVQAVESVYKDLERRWAGKFSSGAVAEQIASIQSGFQAMKADFQKGDYDRILARGDGFKRAIEIVAAHAYVAAMLNKAEVRARLPKSDLEAIQALRREAERNPERLEKQEKFLEAAQLIQSRLASNGSSAKKSPRAQR